MTITVDDHKRGSIEDLRQELRQRERELAAVLKISRALSAKLSPDDLVRETLEVSLQAVGASAGSVYLYDSRQDSLVFRYVVNPDNPEIASRLRGQSIRTDQGIAGRVFRTGTPSVDDDPTHRPEHLREIGEHLGYITRNGATVPLITTEARTIGVLQVLNKAGGPFGPADVELLTIMATQAATAIETARLHEEAKLAAIVHYLGDISHDIKNMISPAQMGVQTLGLLLDAMFRNLDAALATSESQERLARSVGEGCSSLRTLYPETIDHALEGMAGVEERVREIADAVKGVIAAPVFEPASVNEVIRAVAKALRPAADRHGIAIDLSGLESTPAIPLDRKRLYNAIYNLVHNALAETTAGGRVWLRSSLVAAAGRGESWLAIQVEDTGRGMAEDVRQRLFTDQAISTKPGGTGLGTRIVKNVVDAHRGRISVRSAPEHGTLFTIELPTEVHGSEFH